MKNFKTLFLLLFVCNFFSCEKSEVAINDVKVENYVPLQKAIQIADVQSFASNPKGKLTR
jgi:hypothetical protein